MWRFMRNFFQTNDGDTDMGKPKKPVKKVGVTYAVKIQVSYKDPLARRQTIRDTRKAIKAALVATKNVRVLKISSSED